MENKMTGEDLGEVLGAIVSLVLILFKVFSKKN